MSSENRLLALRSSQGIIFCHGPPMKGKYEEFESEENPSCRDMTFNKDCNFFAWCTNERTCIAQTSNYKPLFKVNGPRIAAIQIAPKGTYMSTWEPYTAKQNAQESCNLHIYNVTVGECVKSFIQKKQTGWKLQWSDDEFLCARNVSNEVHFFENSNFDNIAKKIFMQKVAYFSLAPGCAPYHIVCFVPGMKGQPSYVRLFKYPKFEGTDSVVAQKSFFKAERVDFYWNKTGKDCIFLTSVDVDKSGASYYGELKLYYVTVKGDTANIILGKDGPVYSVEWNPNDVEFCVVYGYMPAKATIYNLKCEPVFDFGTGPRNEVHYSPVGEKHRFSFYVFYHVQIFNSQITPKRLTLSGFGNLQGMIEVWDLVKKEQVIKFQATDSTLIQWSNDGEYLLTATTSPRLRIGNGYRIWHYTGSLLEEVFCHKNEELYDIKWKPEPDGKIKAKPTTYTPVMGIQSVVPQVSKQAYRPPAAQGKPASFKLHDDEATKAAAQNSSNATLTKNQKKNLARKTKKQTENIPILSNSEPVVKSENSTHKLTGDPEKDKKIKAILKKLDQIEKLKKDQEAGKSLEINQVEKIKKVGELEAELENLQLN